MARIRTIKPSFFRSEDVAVLPFRARLMWVGLWTHADDQGRAKDNAKLIKGDIWPLDDVTLDEIEEDLAVLAEAGRIVRYEVDGRRYLAVTNWPVHQRIQKPSESKIPPPPEDSGRAPVALPDKDGSGTAGKGRERKGREGTRESAPSPRCPTHTETPSVGPCGPCKDARLTREAWDRNALARAQASADARSAEARQRAADRARAVAACGLCDVDGYRNGQVCDHDPDAPARAARGRARVLAALGRDTTQEAS